MLILDEESWFLCRATQGLRGHFVRVMSRLIGGILDREERGFMRVTITDFNSDENEERVGEWSYNLLNWMGEDKLVEIFLV